MDGISMPYLSHMHSFSSSSFSIGEYELGNQDDLSSHCALKRTLGFG